MWVEATVTESYGRFFFNTLNKTLQIRPFMT